MGSAEELSSDLRKSVRKVLGERFDHGPIQQIKFETKGEKLDTKVLVLSSCRVFILSFKAPTKIEHESNYLEIDVLESSKPQQLKLKLKERNPFTIVTSTAEELDAIIDFITKSLKRTFPNTSLDAFFQIKLEPEERVRKLQTQLDCLSLPDQGPCDGFSQMYNFMCDLHGLPFMPEVAWDIDTIYLSQDTRVLCLNDFDHLEARDLIPIISALQHNSWFTKLAVKDIKLAADATNEIIKVVSNSGHLKQIVLENIGVKWDFAKELSSAISSNSNCALILIDLSNNLIEDRGIKPLCSALAKLHTGLIELNLARTGMTTEGASQLGKSLAENNFFPTSLAKLNLSGNFLKEGEIEPLFNFLAQPNHLTHLDLADCHIALDNIFSALFRGCCSNLSHVNLSGNVYTYKKAKELNIPRSLKQYFATTTKLKVLNFSNTKLPPEVVKEVILGIGSNKSLEGVELDLSCNELRAEGATTIGSCFGNVPNIVSLNLSDNEFNADIANMIDWIRQSKSLQTLDISQNLTNMKPKAIMPFVDTIVNYMQDEESPLRCLSIARNKLKFEMMPIINALGSNTTLTSIDISCNQMGDIGAKMLAKALQINNKLECIKLDGNHITIKGLREIAGALETNYTVKYIPTPISDISAYLKGGANNQEKVDEVLHRIQVLLHRNHSPHKFENAQAFRLQQGFLYTTSHQLVDKLVVQIQDACKELANCGVEEVEKDIDEAHDIITDADNSKQLLEVLRKVVVGNEQDDVTKQLKEMASQIHASVEALLKQTASGMVIGTQELCPTVMAKEELKNGVAAVCQERSNIPHNVILGLIEQLDSQLGNRISEANLAMAAQISDMIIDEIIEALSESQQKLSNHLNGIKGRPMSDYSLLNGPSDREGPVKEVDPQLSPSKFIKKEQKPTVDKKAGIRSQRVKLRPKSTFLQLEDEIAVNPSAHIAEPEPTDTVEKPKPLPVKLVSTPKPDKKAPSSSASARVFVDDKALNEVSTNSSQPLVDVRRYRPRRPQVNRPTQKTNILQTQNNPSNEAGEENTVGEVSAGVEDFFEAKDITDLHMTNIDQASSAAKLKKEKEDKKKEDEKRRKEEKEVKDRIEEEDRKKRGEGKKKAKDIKKKEKEKKEKEKKEKEKKEKEKKEKEKKRGFFSALRNRKGSQPPESAAEEVDNAGDRRASEPAASSQPKPSSKKRKTLEAVAESVDAPEADKSESTADSEPIKDTAVPEQPKPAPRKGVLCAVVPMLGDQAMLQEMKKKQSRRSVDLLDASELNASPAPTKEESQEPSDEQKTPQSGEGTKATPISHKAPEDHPPGKTALLPPSKSSTKNASKESPADKKISTNDSTPQESESDAAPKKPEEGEVPSQEEDEPSEPDAAPISSKAAPELKINIPSIETKPSQLSPTKKDSSSKPSPSPRNSAVLSSPALLHANTSVKEDTDVQGSQSVEPPSLGASSKKGVPVTPDEITSPKLKPVSPSSPTKKFEKINFSTKFPKNPPTSPKQKEMSPSVKNMDSSSPIHSTKNGQFVFPTKSTSNGDVDSEKKDEPEKKKNLKIGEEKKDIAAMTDKKIPKQSSIDAKTQVDSSEIKSSLSSKGEQNTDQIKKRSSEKAPDEKSKMSPSNPKAMESAKKQTEGLKENSVDNSLEDKSYSKNSESHSEKDADGKKISLEMPKTADDGEKKKQRPLSIVERMDSLQQEAAKNNANNSANLESSPKKENGRELSVEGKSSSLERRNRPFSTTPKPTPRPKPGPVPPKKANTIGTAPKPPGVSSPAPSPSKSSLKKQPPPPRNCLT